SHSGVLPRTELLLNGMNGTAPRRSISVRLSADKYALSALISRMVKFSAVLFVNSGSCGQSPRFLSPMTTAVTTFERTPQVRWHFTHSAFWRVTPYFSSNQRVNLFVLKPLLSIAKSTSTDR